MNLSFFRKHSQGHGGHPAPVPRRKPDAPGAPDPGDTFRDTSGEPTPR